MSRNCGMCNYQGDLRLNSASNTREYFCFLKSAWVSQFSDCRNYASYSSNLSREDRIALALQVRRGFEARERREEHRREARASWTAQRGFEYVKLVISFALGIAVGLILSWLT